MPVDDDLLRSVSRSFFLSMRFLPKAMREPISLGYLLARLSDTVADAPELELDERLEILARMRQAIIAGDRALPGNAIPLPQTHSHEGEKHLVAHADDIFGLLGEIDDDNRSHLEEVILTIIHGQSQDLISFPPGKLTALPSGDDLLRYTYWVAGSVGQFWTKVGYTNLRENFALPDKATTLLRQGKKLGQALQLINILRDLHEDLPTARCYLPEDELQTAGWDGESPLTPECLAPVFDRWLALCESYLEEAPSYAGSIRNARVRFSTRLPMILAAKTAKQLREAGVEQVIREKIKIPRSEVWKSMAWATFC